MNNTDVRNLAKEQFDRNLDYITNDSKRRGTFKKRKNGIHRDAGGRNSKNRQ